MRLHGNVFQGVIDARAAVRVLAPRHSVMTTPNRISPTDFTDWITSLAAGAVESWDPHYQPILSVKDDDGNRSSGVLLVADYGQGTIVYSALPIHMQLHAGVPGAFRILANLVSLGKK